MRTRDQLQNMAKTAIAVVLVLALAGVASAQINCTDAGSDGVADNTITVCTDASCNCYVDGVDDQVEINWAINNLTSGDTLQFNSGTYYTSNRTIYDVNNTKINGSGIDNTIIDGTNISDFSFVNSVIHIGHTNNSEGECPTDLLSNMSVSNLTVRANDTFSGARDKNGSPIVVVWQDGINITDVKIADGGFGVHLCWVDDFEIGNSIIESSSRRNIKLPQGYGEYGRIHHNTLSGAGYGNIMFNVNPYGGFTDCFDKTTGVIVDNNTASGSSGGGCIETYGNHKVIIRDNFIYNCRDGGVILNLDQGSEVYRNEIKNNWTATTLWSHGPGIQLGQTTGFDIHHNTIYDSRVGILTRSHDTQNPEGNNKLYNNVIYNNSNDGIRIQESRSDSFIISNNIIVNNSGYSINNTDNLSAVFNHSYNNVWNNELGSYNHTTPDEGNISQNPLFVNPPNDFHLKSTEGRWNGSAWVTDAVDSPCIDAGDPDEDYSNEPAPNGSRINLGAYGNTDEASKGNYTGSYLAKNQDNWIRHYNVIDYGHTDPTPANTTNISADSELGKVKAVINELNADGTGNITYTNDTANENVTTTWRGLNSSLNYTLQRDVDDYYWNGSDWQSSSTAISPTTDNITYWSDKWASPVTFELSESAAGVCGYTSGDWIISSPTECSSDVTVDAGHKLILQAKLTMIDSTVYAGDMEIQTTGDVFACNFTAPLNCLSIS